MNQIRVWTVPSDDEVTASCNCCGRPIYKGAGELRAEEGILAAYWYQWSEGHEGRFVLGIGRSSADGGPVPGVMVVQARVDSENIIYSVLEPSDSPWSSFGLYGNALARDEALADENSPEFFKLVDAVAANERRISNRILSSRLSS